MLEGILILVMVLLIIAAITDLKLRKIPNWIPLSIFILFLAYLGGQHFIEGAPIFLPPVSSLITGFATFLVFAGLFYFNMIGGGDVKLITAVAFFAGQAQIVSFIVLMALAGGILAIFYVFQREKVPDFEVKSNNLAEGGQIKKDEIQVKNSKNKNKSGNIPYGIAISVGGLFVVNRILTNLIA